LATGLITDADGESAAGPVPPTIDAAEEAHLIWQWMTSGRVRVVNSSGSLVLPAAPKPHLSAA
jgi:hypothetical protein